MIPAELRSFDGDSGRFEIAAVTYGTVDSHSTRWIKGVFEESLRRGLPTAHFGHTEDTSRLIAHFYDWHDTDDQLVLVGQMERRERSTWVRRAWEGLKSRVLTDFSVVFTRRQWRTAADGIEEFTKADLHRVDLVLEGSVPGAQLLAFRAAAGLGPVAARHAAALRSAHSGLWTPTGETGSLRVALQEADEALAELEG